MAYPSLTDRRIPYHRDGTVVGLGTYRESMTADQAFGYGVTSYVDGTGRTELNDGDWVSTGLTPLTSGGNNTQVAIKTVWFFFPEQREVSAAVFGAIYIPNGANGWYGASVIQGSNDSTNGMDGTWETGSFPSGLPEVTERQHGIDSWRDGIKPVSFTGPKKTVRLALFANNGGGMGLDICLLHLYGEKAAGQNPDDVIYIDHDTTPGVEYAAPEDFGDRPLGTTVTRQFRVKNASTTKTANSINLQCNDTDFVISTDNSTWVTTINIGSLAAEAESSTMYIRNTTPSPGAVLGPRFAEIVAIVGSWS